MKNKKMPLPVLTSVVSTPDFLLPASVAESVAPTCTLADHAITNWAIDGLKLASAMALDTSSEGSIR